MRIAAIADGCGFIKVQVSPANMLCSGCIVWLMCNWRGEEGRGGREEEGGRKEGEGRKGRGGREEGRGGEEGGRKGRGGRKEGEGRKGRGGREEGRGEEGGAEELVEAALPFYLDSDRLSISSCYISAICSSLPRLPQG